MNFFYIAWSPLMANRANTVMILKTCEALARLNTNWKIHLMFSELPDEPLETMKRYNVKALPNLKLSTIFPESLRLNHDATGRILKNLLNAREEKTKKKCLKWWNGFFSQGKTMIMTRNIAVLDFFRDSFSARVPLILELHQLKYRKAKASDFSTLRTLKTRLKEKRNAELQSIKKADAVFCISRPLADKISHQLTGIPIRILRSAAQLPLTTGPAAVRDIDLLYTGQLYHWKGVHTIIEALRYLPQSIRMAVVGGNSNFDLFVLQSFARNLGVAERIDWLGQLPHENVINYQKRSRIGLVPLPAAYPISRWFTSPIKIFEMMAAGLAMVVADLPSVRDILQAGVTAEFAKPDDPVDWARVIADLLADDNRRNRVAANASALVRDLTFERRAELIGEVSSLLISPTATSALSGSR